MDVKTTTIVPSEEALDFLNERLTVIREAQPNDLEHQFNRTLEMIENHPESEVLFRIFDEFFRIILEEN
jgi:hypothetical protein